MLLSHTVSEIRLWLSFGIIILELSFCPQSLVLKRRREYYFKQRSQFTFIIPHLRPSYHLRPKQSQRQKIHGLSRSFCILNENFTTHKRLCATVTTIDGYARNGGPGEVWLLCSFYHEPFRTWIETNVNTFAVSNHTALKLDVQALRGYLSLICEYELYILPNKKVNTTKDHGKTYMKGRPLLVRHLLRNCLLWNKHHMDRFRFSQLLNQRSRPSP